MDKALIDPNTNHDVNKNKTKEVIPPPTPNIFLILTNFKGVSSHQLYILQV